MPNQHPGCAIIALVPRARMLRLLPGLIFLGGGLTAGMADLTSATARPSDRLAARSCPHPTVPVPSNEPVYRAGWTGVVSGMYVQGGPVPPPPCQAQPRGPYAGTIRVMNLHTGRLLARQSVSDGHLAHIHLAAGRYRLAGHFAGGFTSRAMTITVRPGYRTRQDVFEDVP